MQQPAALEEAALPSLPGFHSLAPLRPGSAWRAQSLVFSHGVPLVKNTGRDAVPAVEAPSHLSARSRRNSNVDVGLCAQRSQWLAHGGEVLRFFAHTVEAVPNSALEEQRVRLCRILHYMEDGTTSIEEAREANSGLPQGTRLRRHRVPSGDAGAFVTWKSLSVGATVSLYGTPYTIHACDDWTRRFLEKCGVRMPADEACPSDAYHEALIFFGVLHEARTDAEGVDVKLTYHLADHTLEATIDKQAGPVRGRFYTWRDMALGRTLCIHGRRVTLTTADPSAAAFLARFGQLFGRTFAAAGSGTVSNSSECAEAQAARACAAEHGATEVQGNARPPSRYDAFRPAKDPLRFRAALHPTSHLGPADAERIFVISYHPQAQEMAIFEPPVANSGVLGGTFLARTKAQYRAHAMHVGASVEASGRTFVLIDADEATMRYMEAHCCAFPAADRPHIESKVRAALRQPQAQADYMDKLMLADRDGEGSLDVRAYHALLRACSVDVTEHEVLTLARGWGAPSRDVSCEAALSLLPHA